jgi:hypothetical protein
MLSRRTYAITERAPLPAGGANAAAPNAHPTPPWPARPHGGPQFDSNAKDCCESSQKSPRGQPCRSALTARRPPPLAGPRARPRAVPALAVARCASWRSRRAPRTTWLAYAATPRSSGDPMPGAAASPRAAPAAGSRAYSSPPRAPTPRTSPPLPLNIALPPQTLTALPQLVHERPDAVAVLVPRD